jgi:hypothetical protein
MWDWVLLVSTLTLTPGILPVIFNRRAYLPRLSSGMFALGISGIAASLFAEGLYLGASANTLSVLGWMFVFIWRGSKVGLR